MARNRKRFVCFPIEEGNLARIDSSQTHNTQGNELVEVLRGVNVIMWSNKRAIWMIYVLKGIHGHDNPLVKQ